MNVELKVYAGTCLTPTTDGMTLARAAAAEVRRLGAASRTLFSSFDEAPIVGLKHEQPDLYAALLTGGPPPGEFERVAGLGLDAIHPFFSSLTAARIAAAKEIGLQVNLWTVDGRAFLQRSVDYQASAIITDEPGVLAAVKAGREDEWTELTTDDTDSTDRNYAIPIRAIHVIRSKSPLQPRSRGSLEASAIANALFASAPDGRVMPSKPGPSVLPCR